MSRPASTYPFSRDTRSGIYLLTNLQNRIVYVGSALNLFNRWRRHLNDLTRGTHGNQHLLRAWKLYGSGGFEWAILEVVADPELLLSREQFWLDHYRTLGPVYNTCLTAGSNQGRKWSEETRAKMSLAAKKRGDNIVRDDEWKEKVSEANRRNASERCGVAMKKKISELKRGNQYVKGLVWVHSPTQNYRVKPNDPRIQSGELKLGRL